MAREAKEIERFHSVSLCDAVQEKEKKTRAEKCQSFGGKGRAVEAVRGRLVGAGRGRKKRAGWLWELKSELHADAKTD